MTSRKEVFLVDDKSGNLTIFGRHPWLENAPFSTDGCRIYFRKCRPKNVKLHN